MPLRKSEDGSAQVVAWENRRGELKRHLDSDDKRVGRAPSDRQLERAKRVIIKYDGEYYTNRADFNPDYTLDDWMTEIESDEYKEMKAKGTS